MLIFFPEQIDPAQEIIKIASLLIEQEAEPLAFLIPPQDIDWPEGSYCISNKVTKSGNYLAVKSNDKRMIIEMFNGDLIFAVGIEEADIDYWRKLEQDFYVVEPS
jgi:hypothetical protein